MSDVSDMSDMSDKAPHRTLMHKQSVYQYCGGNSHGRTRKTGKKKWSQ